MKLFRQGVDVPEFLLHSEDVAEYDPRTSRVTYAGVGWGLRMQWAEAVQFVSTIKKVIDEFSDDDEDEGREIWGIRQTAHEIFAMLLKQCDLPSVMADNGFATAIAERAVFLARKMHAVLPR